MNPNDDDQNVTGGTPVNTGDDTGVATDGGATGGVTPDEVNPTSGAPITGMGDEPVVGGETTPEAGGEEEEKEKEEGDDNTAQAA